MMDLYAILGFGATPRDQVTSADVKKAYRQEALKWHPDKHPPETRAAAEARFKDLAHAFEILSNDAKRSLYDRGGMEAVERGSASPPMSANEEDFGASRHGTDAHGSRRSRARPASHARDAPRGHAFVFRDPFETFDAVFRDMHRMMDGMHGPRFGFSGGGGGGGVFDDPFFRSPFSTDSFFGPTLGGFGERGATMDPFGRGGAMFGPSPFSAFGGVGFGFASPMFAASPLHPFVQPPQQRPVHAMGGGGVPAMHATTIPRGGSHTTTQMFSFSGPAGMQQRQGKSITVETHIENGQRVTRTVQRTYMPDGTVREEVSGPAAPARVAYPVPPSSRAHDPRGGASVSSASVHYPPAQTVTPAAALPPSRISLVAPSAGRSMTMRSATSGPGVGRVGSVGSSHLRFAAPPVPIRVVSGHH